MMKGCVKDPKWIVTKISLIFFKIIELESVTISLLFLVISPMYNLSLIQLLIRFAYRRKFHEKTAKSAL